jgi:hypothetical protein
MNNEELEEFQNSCIKDNVSLTKEQYVILLLQALKKKSIEEGSTSPMQVIRSPLVFGTTDKTHS